MNTGGPARVPGDLDAAAPQRPRVTIGLVVFNGERYFEQALSSLLAQTFTDFELVISDNGSTDQTPVIARRAEMRDPRVSYVRTDVNRGLAWNLDRVLGLARGTYFCWAAADDLYAPEYLAKCVAALDADEGAVYCYANTVMIDPIGRVIGREVNRFNLAALRPSVRFWEQLIVRGGQNLYGVFRTSVLRQTAPHGSTPWAERVRCAELSLRGRFLMVDGDLFFWRRHPEQSTESWGCPSTFATVLDPGRAAWWRHQQPVLWAEYMRGYAAAIRRAPLGARERALCFARLARWILGHVPGLRVRDPRAHSVMVDRSIAD